MSFTKTTDWKPRALAGGGKSAFLERTKTFIFSLTFGLKLWYNENIVLETSILSVTAW